MSDREGRGTNGRASASGTNSAASQATRNAPRTGTSVKSFVQMPRAGNYYLYSFDGRLLARYDVYGFCQSEYIYMGNRLIAERDHVGNRYLYYTSDQINSTRVVTDDSGTVVHAQAYDPYGGIQVNWVPSFDPTPKFSGKERDTESGLDYFGARYYDNSQYRFISVDPETSPRGRLYSAQLQNLYNYCRDNPTSYIDPNGAASFRCVVDAVKQVPAGYKLGSGQAIGEYGWGVIDSKYTLNISPSRTSLDVVGHFTILILSFKNAQWYSPLTWASPAHTIWHEYRHLQEIGEYVNKRIQELEPLWTKDGLSKEEIGKRIDALVQEAAAKTKNKWDGPYSFWGFCDWAESWYFRFSLPFTLLSGWGTNTDELKKK